VDFQLIPERCCAKDLVTTWSWADQAGCGGEVDPHANREQMPERTIELASYHAILGCVAAGMGISLIPKSVLTTFPERRRLSVRPLPPKENSAQTVLIWRNAAGSASVRAWRKFCGAVRAPIKVPDSRMEVY
jgi:DNA-binding transcriptional LysR family regulator